MVGGVVIEVSDVPDLPDRLFVDCRERRSQGRPDTCAIYVVKNEDSRLIEVGDSLWWQGGIAYWTPQVRRVGAEEAERLGYRGGVHYDIQIPRIGCSGVTHPSRSTTC